MPDETRRGLEILAVCIGEPACLYVQARSAQPSGSVTMSCAHEACETGERSETHDRTGWRAAFDAGARHLHHVGGGDDAHAPALHVEHGEAADVMLK